MRRLAETRVRRLPVETPGRLPPLLVEVSDDVRIGILLLERALEAARGELAPAGEAEAAPGDRPVLTVGQGGAWFEVDGGERVDLSGRAVLRRVLWSLCERQIDTPGRAISTRELCAAAWPGERMRPRSGASRLYVALGELRKLGLRDVIASDGGGYCLRCEIRVVF
jgi:hypothetical protein